MSINTIKFKFAIIINCLKIIIHKFVIIIVIVIIIHMLIIDVLEV